LNDIDVTNMTTCYREQEAIVQASAEWEIENYTYTYLFIAEETFKYQLGSLIDC